MSNVANRGKNVPVGWTQTDTIGPRSRSRLSARYVLVVLKWRKNRSIFNKARRVFSFDIVQSDSFLCWPTDKHNREAFACKLTSSQLASIIVNVSVTFENLPVVWIGYNWVTFHIYENFIANLRKKKKKKEVEGGLVASGMSCLNISSTKQYIQNISNAFFRIFWMRRLPNKNKMHTESSKQVRESSAMSRWTKISCVRKVGGTQHTKI